MGAPHRLGQTLPVAESFPVHNVGTSQQLPFVVQPVRNVQDGGVRPGRQEEEGRVRPGAGLPLPCPQGPCSTCTGPTHSVPCPLPCVLAHLQCLLLGLQATENSHMCSWRGPSLWISDQPNLKEENQKLETHSQVSILRKEQHTHRDHLLSAVLDELMCEVHRRNISSTNAAASADRPLRGLLQGIRDWGVTHELAERKARSINNNEVNGKPHCPYFSHFSLDCPETSSGTHTRHTAVSGNLWSCLTHEVSSPF